MFFTVKPAGTQKGQSGEGWAAFSHLWCLPRRRLADFLYRKERPLSLFKYERTLKCKTDTEKDKLLQKNVLCYCSQLVEIFLQGKGSCLPKCFPCKASPGFELAVCSGSVSVYL